MTPGDDQLADIVAADEDVVTEVLERFRAFYENMINMRAAAGETTRHLDFLMAIHNFHVLAIMDVMGRDEACQRSATMRAGFLMLWGRTFAKRIEKEVAKVLEPRK